VLETAGREWAARQVKDFYAISNSITIRQDWDLASANLVPYAVSRGWCGKPGEFDFFRCYSDPLMTYFAAASHRRQMTTSHYEACSRQMDLRSAMRLLRSHAATSSGDWSPDKALAGSQVCMHLGFGPVRINQTVGSMVSHLTAAGDTHWCTASAAPCTAVFKPVWIDASLPGHGPIPEGTYDDRSLFWQHERLHRSILRDFQVRLGSIQEEKDALEDRFREGAAAVKPDPSEARLAYSQACFDESRSALSRWIDCVARLRVRKQAALYHRAAWKRINRQAGMPGPI
jgi:hypothetical protein